MSRELPNPAVLMFVAHRHVEQRVLAALAEAGYDDITTAQSRVFQRIGPDGTRLTTLAEQAQVTKQTAGFLVDQLEKAGYVERGPDPSDARARLVRIAERGQRAIEASAGVVAEVDAEWRAHLGHASYEEMVTALEKLRELTDPEGR
ncbi:MAG TPA: MarR family transcriptional regulator [Nocardioides sp.]